ncbi:MAG: hypothetical protein NTY88_10375 [Bacteroidetes bacterium]|nr:hypothetical protein [Bacteroidota bacterium]
MKFYIPVALLFLTACSSPQKLLLKSWKIDEVVFIDSLNAYTAEQKQNISSEFKNSFDITFLADSTFLVHHNGNAIIGTWFYDAKQKLIYSHTPNEGRAVSTVYELKKDFFKFATGNSEHQRFVYSCSPASAKQ